MYAVTNVIGTISGDYLLSSGGYYFLSMSWVIFSEKMGKLRVATPKEEPWGLMRREEKIAEAIESFNEGLCPWCGRRYAIAPTGRKCRL